MTKSVESIVSKALNNLRKLTKIESMETQFPDKTIVVVSPGYHKTGGTELLHQLYWALSGAGFKTVLAYFGGEDKGINPSFAKYAKSFTSFSCIKDLPGNVIVVPETLTALLQRFNSSIKVIWWESVDFYLQDHSLLYRASELFSHPRPFFGLLKKKILGREAPLLPKELRKVDYHLVQSKYAESFLKKMGIQTNVLWLSDYINDLYVEGHGYLQNKQNIICYNPKKGLAFTKKVIKRCPDYFFRPLEKLSETEMKRALSEAKIYVDFGRHPGKDRIPREAAICGCCILVAKAGSAAFFDDVPIPEKYKFPLRRGQIKNIRSLIQVIFEKYEDAQRDFIYYKKIITEEKERFKRDVVLSFSTICKTNVLGHPIR